MKVLATRYYEANTLQTRYFCRSAQTFSALASPCIPLLLLALCMPLEAVRHGAGTEPGWGSNSAPQALELQPLRRQLGPEVADGALHRGSLQLHGPTQLPQSRWRL